MLFTKEFEEVAKKLCDALPQNMRILESDLKQQFKEILQSAFVHLDLVTHEEFDVQVKVLARTREKVAALEKELLRLTQEKDPF